MQTEGWRRGTSKQQITKEDKVAYQLGSIIVQSVSHAKLCADIIRQGQAFLDDRLRKYARMSNKADDLSRG